MSVATGNERKKNPRWGKSRAKVAKAAWEV
jgi:hypothetical protein